MDENPIQQRSNLLKLDMLGNLTKHSVSAKPDTLQIYSFSGAGGVSDQLFKNTKKITNNVSKYAFHSLKKHQKPIFERRMFR